MELNFDTERNALQVKKAELMEGVAIIDEALAALDRGSRNNGTRAAAANATGVRAGRKPMSAKAKAAASKRMKAYWAARRKAER
jgi:hypothetical protein